ncbi:hypothetical protein ACQP2E_28075 [Actinoplanes sp. CA-015351]|uniref:hypothetical protein n=1 Tax=Actinoplanes sp. CA-015351 TaxID=3239897 RepID=UPI003D981F7E
MEILRDLMGDLDDTGLAADVLAAPGRLDRYRFRLGLLTTRLPFWDEVMECADTDAVLDRVGLGAAFQSAVAEIREAGGERAAAVSEFTIVQEALLHNAVSGSAEVEYRRRFGELGSEIQKLQAREAAAEEESARLLRDARDILARRLADDVTTHIQKRIQSSAAVAATGGR